MAGIGIALVWAGYTAGLYGYCLFKGYDVTVAQLFSSKWPPGVPSDGADGGGFGHPTTGAGA